MKLHKLLTALAIASMAAFPALAQEPFPDGVCQTCDAVGTLPAPGILGLVMLGIVAAIGFARRYR